MSERMTVLIWLGQIVSHILDGWLNDSKSIGVILMVAIVCHLVNKEKDGEGE